MTDHDDLERAIAGWLEDRAQSSGPVEGVERVLDATRRQQPRPGWLAVVGGRWIGDTGRAGRGLGGTRLTRLDLSWSTAVVVLLLALAIVGGSILVAAQVVLQPAPRDPRLAYIADGTLYLADWDGRNPIRLDGAPMSADGCRSVYSEGPLWSPDGQYLAYRSGWGTACGAATEQTVHIRDAEGSGVAEYQAGVGWKVAWAPDSRRIATWSTVEGRIDIRGADGVLQAQVTLPAGFCVCADRDPAWTHDGTALLLRMRDSYQSSQFWRLPIPDGPPSVLGEGDILELAFSKDGTQAAFWADDSLRVAPADDMTVARVAVKIREETGPVWSPVGDRVAVTTVRVGTLGDAGPEGPWIEDLQVLDVARGQLSTLATATERDGLRPLAFTPAGDQILFKQTNEGHGSLWTITTDGSTGRELVSDAEWGDWQPIP